MIRELRSCSPEKHREVVKSVSNLKSVYPEKSNQILNKINGFLFSEEAENLSKKERRESWKGDEQLSEFVKKKMKSYHFEIHDKYMGMLQDKRSRLNSAENNNRTFKALKSSKDPLSLLEDRPTFTNLSKDSVNDHRLNSLFKFKKTKKGSMKRALITQCIKNQTSKVRTRDFNEMNSDEKEKDYFSYTYNAGCLSKIRRDIESRELSIDASKHIPNHIESRNQSTKPTPNVTPNCINRGYSSGSTPISRSNSLWGANPRLNSAAIGLQYTRDTSLYIRPGTSIHQDRNLAMDEYIRDNNNRRTRSPLLPQKRAGVHVNARRPSSCVHKGTNYLNAGGSLSFLEVNKLRKMVESPKMMTNKKNMIIQI